MTNGPGDLEHVIRRDPVTGDIDDDRYPDGIAPVQRKKESRAFAYAGWAVAAVAAGVIIFGYLLAINWHPY